MTEATPEQEQAKKQKQYRKFVNGRQTGKERRQKYKFVKKAKKNSKTAYVLRDWTWSHINQFITGKRKEKQK
jgi:hypothetical protein